MGEILGIGCTHTGLNGDAVELRDFFAHVRERRLLSATTAPEFKDLANWPPQMIQELGEDQGLSVAHRYWNDLLHGFREARKAIEEFNPDFVLIYGDDQYEAIKEDLVPAFTIFAIPEQPLNRRRPNTPGGAAMVPSVSGHVEAATHLVRTLINEDFDIASSQRPPHGDTYGHAFTNTVDFLSFDGQGFPWPLVPVHVNCYGLDLGPGGNLFPPEDMPNGHQELPVSPPPSPTPRRCYDLGKAIAKIIADSPWRAVIIGSSSWSHATLTPKHYYLWPDVPADRARKAELVADEFWKWRDLDPDQVTDSGQNELLNWCCLAGGMEGRHADLLAYCESYLFNSTRLVARFEA